MREHAYRAAENAYWAAYGVGPREETVVDVPTLGTAARVQFVGEGPPILFVHGGPNAGTTWAPVVSALSDHRCIVIDRPGCGLSPPVDYRQASLQEIAATMLLEVLDGLAIDRAHVVGSSLGGAFALWFASQHPRRVGTVVQMSSPPFLPEMNMDAALFLRLLGLPFLGALLTKLPASDVSLDQTFRNMGHARSLDAGTFPPEFFAWGKSMMNDTDVMRNDRRAVQKGMSFRAVRPDVVITDDVFRAIESHVYWFWGDADPFGPLAAAERACALMRSSEIEVLEGGGHLPWLDAPHRAEAAIRRALDGSRSAD